MQHDKPLIVVVGSTSKQGRSVAMTLLQSHNFRVRALTRDASSPAARALQDLGAEIVNVPLELGRTKEFVAAFEGATGAFLMTPPVAPPDMCEAPLGQQLADAAVAAGVQHIVFSTLENVDKISGGTKYAPHFTDKAKVADHIRGLSISHSFIMLAFLHQPAGVLCPPLRGRYAAVTDLTSRRFPRAFRRPANGHRTPRAGDLFQPFALRRQDTTKCG
jgi:uncharacterized protein YbjT (DUF2867 family)